MRERSTHITAWVRRHSFDRRLSFVLFAALSAIAVARALQHVYVVDIHEPFQYTLVWHIPFNLFLWWSWFLFVPVMDWTMGRIPAERSTLLHSILLYLALPVVVITARQAAATLIATLALADKTDFALLFYWRLFSNPWLWLDLIVYFAILLGLHLAEYRRRLESSSLRRMQLQTQYVSSQLDALRSQLHPHFLFNTLNTVSTLILKEDNEEAGRMLALLTRFLHTTSADSSKSEVPLRDELRFINDYLGIEQVRFSGRLTVTETVDEETLDAMVPAFLLQPIVENAIYHAIAVRPEAGTLSIAARRDGAMLVLTVEDNGPGFVPASSPKSAKKEGVGLSITRSRLEHRYGPACRFESGNREEGGARVRLTLPFASQTVGAALI